jgi:hypothetical protein
MKVCAFTGHVGRFAKERGRMFKREQHIRLYKRGQRAVSKVPTMWY